MALDPKKDIHATTPEGLAEYIRKRDNGGGGGRPPTIKEWFNNLVSDKTEALRISAERTIRHQRMLLKDRIRATPDPEIAAALQEIEDKLAYQFSAVVNGGVEGAKLAVQALIKFGPVPLKNDPA